MSGDQFNMILTGMSLSGVFLFMSCFSSLSVSAPFPLCLSVQYLSWSLFLRVSGELRKQTSQRMWGVNQGGISKQSPRKGNDKIIIKQENRMNRRERGTEA